VSEQASPQTIDDRPAPRPGGVRRRALALTLAAVALVLVAAGGGWWWLTHPDRLVPAGGAESSVPITLGHRLYEGMFAQPESGTVHVDRVVPHVVTNTARADFRVLLCHSSIGHNTIGSVLDRTGRLCQHPRDPRGADLPTLASNTYLVLEVTPHRPGTVRVEGLRVTYHAGWRRGTEDSGTNLTVRVTRGTGH